MRAAVYYSNRDVRLEEVEAPTAGPGELVVRIEASGICGSDVMEWYRAPKAPVVLGHEIAGVVVEVGDGVDAFRIGDRVVATHHVPCDRCRYCRTGRHSVCDTLRSTSFDPGGFAERVRLPAINVERGTFRLDDRVSFEAASFVEPLACVLRGFRECGFRPGMRVAVLGAGVSGGLAIQTARALGAGPIVATDVADSRIAGAVRLGADAAIDARDPGAVARVREALDGAGAELAVVCAASASALDQAVAALDRGGALLPFAPLAPGEAYAFPMWDLWRDCVRVVHSYAGPPADMACALDLLTHGRVEVDAMVTHRLPLAETGVGFRLMTEGRAEALKVIVQPQR